MRHDNLSLLATSRAAMSKAWANIDGGSLLPNGTCKLRAAHNVASVRWLRPGTYDVTFGTPLNDEHYACFVNTSGEPGKRSAALVNLNDAGDGSMQWVQPTKQGFVFHISNGLQPKWMHVVVYAS
jgi:hypothetical protein